MRRFRRGGRRRRSFSRGRRRGGRSRGGRKLRVGFRM